MEFLDNYAGVGEEEDKGDKSEIEFDNELPLAESTPEKPRDNTLLNYFKPARSDSEGNITLLLYLLV